MSTAMEEEFKCWTAKLRVNELEQFDRLEFLPGKEAHYASFKNSSGSMPACLRMARSVPSGMSPGWLGMVV